MAYAILALLFMLVDTIPLIVKFFTKPGPYDALVDCEEVRFDRERKTFLESYNRYMEQVCGYALEEMRGKDWFENFLPAGEHQRIREVFDDACGGERIVGNVNPIVTKAGEIEAFKLAQHLRHRNPSG